MYKFAATSLLCASLVWCSSASAQESALRDVNGDGVIQILAFGDSLTYGVGDGRQPFEEVEVIEETGPKRGYPTRLENFLGVNVSNRGVPGERLTLGAVERFPGEVVGASADLVIIMEGANDAIERVSTTTFSIGMQRMINVARAEGKNVVIMTPPPPTERRSGLATFTNAYAASVRNIGAVNEIPVVDVEKGFQDACPDLTECSWYNLPEGLHPNTRGYTGIGQLVSATLLEIDLSAPDSAVQLEAALGLPSGSALVGNRPVQ